MNTIQEKWESYLKTVMPADAPAAQIRECRIAFYAGAVMMMETMKSISDTDNEDAAVAMLEGLEDECNAFFEGVRSGAN